MDGSRLFHTTSPAVSFPRAGKGGRDDCTEPGVLPLTLPSPGLRGEGAAIRQAQEADEGQVGAGSGEGGEAI